jgi:hypothetical protein
MTERDYCLYLIGHNKKEIDDFKTNRKTWYLIAQSFADPKKFPKNESLFMPLPNEKTKTRAITPEQINAIDNKFRNIKKQKLNG